MPAAGLSLLTLNIGNPSPDRARRQLAWLIRRDEDILVLTETKASAGCLLLAEELTAAGYAVHYPRPGAGEYGTMIVSTVPATPDDGFGDRVGYLPSRAAAVILPAPAGAVRVIGLYVPARDASPGKTERKRKWLAACDAALAAALTEMPSILLGDLNVVEPDHWPRYPFFAPFEYDFYRALAGPHGLTDVFRQLHPDEAEYSWVGRAGDGYRYDHAFCCQSLSGYITDCDYLHQPREDGLTDHSALRMRLAIIPPTPASLRLHDAPGVPACELEHPADDGSLCADDGLLPRPQRSPGGVEDDRGCPAVQEVRLVQVNDDPVWLDVR